MAWTKAIDRTKFPRDAWVMCSWSENAGKWFCALFPTQEDDEPSAAGQGDDPLEAMLAMCIELGAVADTGEWKSL